MLNITFRAGAGAASRYGSGYSEMMRLLAALAPQHWLSGLLYFNFMYVASQTFLKKQSWSPRIQILSFFKI
jgi:hypothetical protein